MKGWKSLGLVGATWVMMLAIFSPLWGEETAAPPAAAPSAAAVAEAPPVTAPPAPDPTGANTGGIGDIGAKVPGKPTLEEVAAEVGHTKVSVNMVWTLIAGFLVMFMQAGFALVETGLTRAKNAAHTMGMNFMVYALGMTGFWIMGYALMYGGVGALGTLGGTPLLDSEVTLNLFGKPFGLFGYKGFFLGNGVYDVSIFTMFLFQMVFMDTAATIPTGAMAERWKFFPFVLFALFLSMFTYPVFGNWVWGGGWLAQLGANFGLGHGSVDFAGSSVVHMVGGVTALAGAIIIGPRIGKYNKDGSVNPIPGHHLPMAIVGTFILAFGWFGFNAGSSLAGTDLRISVVAVNTMLASASGAIAAMIYMWARFGKPDPSMMANGMLAGMVAITAPCAFVNALSAFTIGGIAGLLVCIAVFFVEQKLKIDDPVGAISVHGVCGAFGVLSVGLFADGTYGEGLNGVKGAVRGLFYGDAGQLVAQLIDIGANFVFIFGASYAFFKIVEVTIGNRVSPQVELEGLDIPEMGALAYPEFALSHMPTPSDTFVSPAAKKPAVKKEEVLR